MVLAQKRERKGKKVGSGKRHIEGKSGNQQKKFEWKPSERALTWTPLNLSPSLSPCRWAEERIERRRGRSHASVARTALIREGGRGLLYTDTLSDLFVCPTCLIVQQMTPVLSTNECVSACVYITRPLSDISNVPKWQTWQDRCR